MGLLDGFTSDGNVDMKHTEYYKLMREAAKAELMENAEKLKARDAAGEKKKPEKWSCETCVNNTMRETFTAGECETCEDGSHYEAIDGTRQQGKDQDGEKEDGSHGNE